MQVRLLSYSALVEQTAEEMGYQWHHEGDYVTDQDDIVEIAGRRCYESWGRPNPETATNEGYIANVIAKGHTTLFEHVYYGFDIQGVPTSLTHEFVRHRHHSFSQRSYRFVDATKGGFVMPPEFDRLRVTADLSSAEVDGIKHKLLDHYETTMELYQELYRLLRGYKIPKKRARGAARSVVPAGQSTALEVTANLSAWMWFIDKRAAFMDDGEPYADIEIFHMAREILAIINDKSPNAVQDLRARDEEWRKTPYAAQEARYQELLLGQRRADIAETAT